MSNMRIVQRTKIIFQKLSYKGRMMMSLIILGVLKDKMRWEWWLKLKSRIDNKKMRIIWWKTK